MFGFSKMPKLSGHKNKMSGWPPPGPGCWGGLQGPPFSWDSMNSTSEGRDCLTTKFLHFPGRTSETKMEWMSASQVSQSSSLEEVPLDGAPPAPRLVEMTRDPVLGFGFVAGSEKPVVVRSVTPGGPSEGRLLPGDEIIMINDEPVGSAPRERVIDLVRSCKESIMLTVVQPYPSPKSAFISAAKKAMLKSNPVKVRFAEEVIINGQVPNPVKDNSLLFMPNVLKVYLENGQTKSFRFDAGTSVKNVILTLQEKLSIKCIEHFSLALEQRTDSSGSKLLLLHEQEMLTQVTQRPGSDKMKCFFRIGFVPRDPVELLRRDAVAFEYLYVQSCNDVVSERFGPELKYDAALRLAALQMYILTVTTRQSQKVSLKYIQKEWGLTPFLPPTVLSSTKEKNIKKALTHILKTNQNLVPPGKKLTALQAKVHYLRYLSELRLYGGREFKAILLQGEKRTEVTLLVGPRYGISHVINAWTNLAALLADFSHVNRIEILTEDKTDVRLELHVLDVRPITLIMDSSDAMNLACLTAGYYRLLVDSRRSIFSMAHCNNTGGDDNCQDHIPEWPYSMSLGDDEGPPPIPAEVYDGDSQCSDGGRWENSISPYFHECENPVRDIGMQRSPAPPPLPPATRHKSQDSPRCAKVSFIFGGNPPLNKHNNLGSKKPSERPEVSEHGPPNNDTNRQKFQFAGLTHVYGNIVSVEGGEEPLLRDLFYREVTDDAEDDEDGSCEEDSAGGMPASDSRGGEDENGVHRGGGSAGKAMFLTLSCSTDDIIDLTSLPPPEGDDGIDEDDDDTLLQTLNLAIAAPPPDFQDSSDEDAAPNGKQPSVGDDNEDIPVSSIDSVPTHGEDEGSESVRGERRPENMLMNTLRATEALAVCDRRLPTPASNSNNPGVYTTRGYSPESSSDSGNETNSSEMTEICELVATHRLRESHARLLVATREGYQPLPEEKTEFPVSPSTGGIIQERPPSSAWHLRPPAVPPRRSPLPDPPSLGPDNWEVGAEAALRRPSSTTPGGKHQKKTTDSVGKYNTFSTREGHRGESDGRRLNLDRSALFCEREESQRRQNSFLIENSIADGLRANSLPHDSQRVPCRSSSTSDRPSDSGESGGADSGVLAAERDEHLVVASLPSPTKKFRSGGSDQGSDVQSERRPLSKQQSVARLCEYHLAKRISNLQGETHSSLQGSQCSSLDAGSTNSSACATPTDSPLGPCAADSKHPHLQRHPLSGSSSSLIRAVNYEDNKAGPFPSIPGQNLQGKDLHPHADPALLRKMLPNIHPPATRSESGPPSSATPTKRKETISCDPHAKHQAYFKGLSQKEGSEAYRQLINYLTVSQMHQGGKLHSAGGGGAAKKDNRRFITSNPQLMETVKSRGNVIARHPRTPSSTSSLFFSPSVAIGNSAVTHPRKQSSPSYRSATLPAKFKKTPEGHVQSPSDGFNRRSATVERRSSLSGLESEPERNGMDPERFLWPYDRESGFPVNRPPPRSKSQPCGSAEERFISEPRATLSVCLSPPRHPNGRLVFSGDRRVDLDATSLGRGDRPSPFTPQMSTGGNRGTSPSPIASPPPPADSGSSNLGRTRDLVQFQQNQSVGATPPQTIGDNPQRGREPKRTSNDAASVELAFDKSTRSRRKRLSKSYSQGSVSSHATRWSTGSQMDGRRASVAFPLPKDTKHAKGPQKLDASPWRCNGPFSYCFFKRKSEGEEDDIERERPRSLGEIDDDSQTCEQLYGEVLDNMSFSDRLSRINALKDRTYRFPSGFDDVRRDAAELAALVRSAVGRRDRGVPMPIPDASQYKRLLSAESKELGRACRRMALAHGSPEEMLLAVTCSFQVLCCLCEACMCLVRGLGTSASQQQREVAVKADEVVANYLSLLKAAEAAAVGAPGEGSAKALVRHSGTMSAIVDALARSLKTLLSK